MTETCRECGKEYGIGEYPFCPHGLPQGLGPAFRAYLDEINFDRPIEITSLGQKRQLMKAYGLEERDAPKAGDISARVDRCMEMRRCQRNQ
jgi:hypothetical protein